MVGVSQGADHLPRVSLLTVLPPSHPPPSLLIPPLIHVRECRRACAPDGDGGGCSGRSYVQHVLYACLRPGGRDQRVHSFLLARARYDGEGGRHSFCVWLAHAKYKYVCIMQWGHAQPASPFTTPIFCRLGHDPDKLRCAGQ